MSDEAEALAEAARNRGLTLKRSRVRTPGKGDYGKYGLTDAAGHPVLGIKGKSLSATADEVRAFLRHAATTDWNESLTVADQAPARHSGTRRSKPGALPSKPKRSRPAQPQPSSPPPEPEPERAALRDARPADAPAIAALIALLGHKTDAANVRSRLDQIAIPQRVATIGAEVVGLCGLDVERHIHRRKPVGRITILAVGKDARGRGLGRLLVEDAQQRLRAAGCGMVEVTSNDRLTAAHAFYRHLGFERTSMRFVRSLDT